MIPSKLAADDVIGRHTWAVLRLSPEFVISFDAQLK